MRPQLGILEQNSKKNLNSFRELNALLTCYDPSIQHPDQWKAVYNMKSVWFENKRERARNKKDRRGKREQIGK